jgi:hypothetical protein
LNSFLIKGYDVYYLKTNPSVFIAKCSNITKIRNDIEQRFQFLRFHSIYYTSPIIFLDPFIRFAMNTYKHKVNKKSVETMVYYKKSLKPISSTTIFVFGKVTEELNNFLLKLRSQRPKLVNDGRTNEVTYNISTSSLILLEKKLKQLDILNLSH